MIVDFYCPRAKVAIELDGAHHDPSADAVRDRELLTRGVVVFRFENFQVRENLPAVLSAIRDLVVSRAALNDEGAAS